MGHVLTDDRFDEEHGKCINLNDKFWVRWTKAFAKSLGGIYDEDTFSFKLPYVTLSCEDIRNLTREKLADLVKPQAEIQDLDQVKLTLDLSRMVVREERYSPSSAQPQKFSGEEYQCQSLGITVPEIDTSQSLTPIGRDL